MQNMMIIIIFHLTLQIFQLQARVTTTEHYWKTLEPTKSIGPEEIGAIMELTQNIRKLSRFGHVHHKNVIGRLEHYVLSEIGKQDIETAMSSIQTTRGEDDLMQSGVIFQQPAWRKSKHRNCGIYERKFMILAKPIAIRLGRENSNIFPEVFDPRFL